MCGLTHSIGSLVNNVGGAVKNFVGGSVKAAGLSDWARQVDAPFANSRPKYEADLQTLMDNPASITTTPGYQFGLDQGLQAVMRKLAQQGYGGSGNEGIALNNYAQDYATNFLGKQQQFLAQLAGANINPDTKGAIDAEKNSYDQGKDVFTQLMKGAGALFG